MVSVFVATRLKPSDADALRHAARLHGRSLAAELRAATFAHLAATERALRNDERPVGPGAVETPPAMEAERAVTT